MIFTSLLYSGKKKDDKKNIETGSLGYTGSLPARVRRVDRTRHWKCPFWAVIASSATCKLQGDEIHGGGGGEGGIRNEDNYSILKRGDLYCGALFLWVFFWPFFSHRPGGVSSSVWPRGCQQGAGSPENPQVGTSGVRHNGLCYMLALYNHRNNVHNKLHSQRGR